MSDISTEGPPDKPYRENPPTHFTEVHWKTLGATTWPTKPFSYLESTVLSSMSKLADSFTGTASFWLRTNDPTWTVTGTYEPEINIIYVPGPRFFEIYEYEGADHNTYLGNVPDYGFYIRIARNDMVAHPGSLRCIALVERAIGDITSRFSFASEGALTGPASLPGDIVDHKWAHFLLTWNLNAAGGGSGTLTVNKIARTVYYNRQSSDYNEVAAVTVPFVPRPIAWKEAARFFGAEGIYADPGDTPTIGPAVPFLDNWFISLAHVWVSTTQIISDVTKFVSDDDTPAKLSEAGGIILAVDPVTGKVLDEIKPDFYFRGAPKTFVENIGAGGEMKLAGEGPIIQTINPKIGA